MINRRFPSMILLAAGCVAFVSGPLVSFAQSKRTNPTSKIYVAEAKGESQIDTGEKIEALSVKSVYSAEGAMIETKADSSDALVFSNGTALFVGASTRFEIKKFVQEPFTPNRNDLDVEPSISQTAIKLLHGSIGVCTSRLVAGSSMVYTTPHCTINIRGHKVLIEVGQDETRVSLLEGDVTVVGEGAGNGQTLAGGQQAIIRKSASDQSAVVTIQPIDATAGASADEQVSLACISRRTVYFEAEENTSDIRPVQVVPANLPTQFTVSPARINP